MRLTWLGLALALAGGPALGQSLPDPGAPEGARQSAHSERAFDRYALPVAPFTADQHGTRAIEGRIVWSAFRLDDPSATTTTIAENYRSWLSEQSFTPILDCSAEACGGFDFRFGAAILPAPGMQMDATDFVQLTAEKPAERLAASILVTRVLGTIYIQTVMIGPGEPPTTLVVQEAAVTQPETLILPSEERVLHEALLERGHVRVEGLDFSVGGAQLTESSSQALDMLARLMTRNEEISVIVVGHSDNEGSLEANLELSKRRAEAVRDTLIERGVGANRLDAHGVGFLAPVTSNASQGGRALNRRVELVLR